MTPRIPVTVLGATGVVGQKFVALLADHPWFEVVSLCASEKNEGKRYGDAVHWLERTPLPAAARDLVLQRAEPGLRGRIAFSALDATAARTIEPRFAATGTWVVTNASPSRMDADVPLLIPEINAVHLALLEHQRATRRWDAGIVANPNCSAVVLASALGPLQQAFGVERVFASTMQAVSGAGYPGLSAIDSMGNVIPYIGGEEEKIERETCKILGAAFPVSAHANRVPVLDGHAISISVALAGRPGADDVVEALRAFQPPPDVCTLPSAPGRFMVVHDAPDRPQPRLDADLGGGMSVSVGRVRSCPILHVRLVALAHNTIRGAAGAALLNAELLIERGVVPRPS